MAATAAAEVAAAAATVGVEVTERMIYTSFLSLIPLSHTLAIAVMRRHTGFTNFCAKVLDEDYKGELTLDAWRAYAAEHLSRRLSAYPT